jgi:pimeloyl-ACP methyl ester carboxylesterase
MREMERASIGSLELEYELVGTGEPVVLLHWGIGARWAEPLLREPALAGRHRLLNYHRVGFAGSDRVEGAISMAEHAEHCSLLLGELGLGSAHVVGHSSSALLALQVALDFPEAVRSLVLMEPARPTPPTEVQAEFVREFVQPAVGFYRDGDHAAAVDRFATGVFGPEYRAPLERGLPGGFEQALADADAFFGQELPAVQDWALTAEDAARIAQPVLAVLGEHTAPAFPERLELLSSWLPNVEHFQLPGATHLLHVVSPGGMAEALAAFFARHSVQNAQVV